MVELSAQARAVPVCARVLKFSVSGTPNAVMLPPFVTAEDGCTRVEMPTPMQSMATAIIRAMSRRRDPDWGVDLDIGVPLTKTDRALSCFGKQFDWKNGYRLKLARKQDSCTCQTGLPKEDGECSEKVCTGQPENPRHVSFFTRDVRRRMLICLGKNEDDDSQS